MTGDPIASSVTKAALGTACNWLRRKLRPDTSRQALDTVADDLSEKVEGIERKRLIELQVPHGLAIPVRFDVVAPSEASGSATMSGTLPSVATFYQSLGSQKRLIVVGEPGAGKTVLVLQLIIDLLEDRKDHRDPVPVRFNATGWDGSSSLDGFLEERLNAEYSIPRRVARALVESARIVPVIDGLDEMDVTGHAPVHGIDAVERFNEPLRKTSPLVVTCRREVYEAILADRDGAGIASSTPVVIKPLQTDEVVKYVQNRIHDYGVGARYAQALKAMIERLENDPWGALGVALRTPWMLTLALSYLTYADPSQADTLIQADSEGAIAEQLFAAQIPAACASQKGPRDEWTYSEAQVQRWMRVFAGFVSTTDSGQPRTQASLDHLWYLAGERRTLRLRGLVSGLVSGLPFGLACGLSSGVLSGLAYGLVFGLLMFWVTNNSPRPPSRVYLRAHRRNELRLRLLYGLVYGLVYGLLCALLGGLATLLFWLGDFLITGQGPGTQSALRTMLLSWLALGLAAGLLVVVIYIPVRFRTPQEANNVIHDDAFAGLVFVIVVFGLGVGLGMAAPRQGNGGLALALTIALAVALATGLEAAGTSITYGCAVVIFSRTGLFPPQPAKFLKWSTDRGLVRITGTSYQFRHDTYRQWLLTHPAPEAG